MSRLARLIDFVLVLGAAAMVAAGGRQQAPPGCDPLVRSSGGTLTCITLRNDTREDLVLAAGWRETCEPACAEQRGHGFGMLVADAQVVVPPGRTLPLLWVDDAQVSGEAWTGEWTRGLRLGGEDRGLALRLRGLGGSTGADVAIAGMPWSSGELELPKIWPRAGVRISRRPGAVELLVFAPRPFYIIAHRTNSLEVAGEALTDGANALELDVRVDGDRLCANHDEITESAGCEDLVALLDGLRGLAAEHPGFALVILDLKESGGRPDLGGEVLRLARTHLTRATGIKLMVSVAKLSRAGELGSAVREVGPGEAVAIDEEDDPAAVARWFSARGVRRYAYGNGIATFAREPDIRPSIERAVRSERTGGRFRMVYVWTLEDPDSMQAYIELGVDGILVNARGSGEGATNGVPDLVEIVRRSAIVVPAPREHDPFTTP